MPIFSRHPLCQAEEGKRAQRKTKLEPETKNGRVPHCHKPVACTHMPGLGFLCYASSDEVTFLEGSDRPSFPNRLLMAAADRCFILASCAAAPWSFFT